jgi:phosphate transport system substrate-binding protein
MKTSLPAKTKLSIARVLLGVVGTCAISFGAYAAEITGAGATFPYPAYAKWAELYKAKTNVALNYQSIGSGGGIKQIEAKTVDFGASDMPLEPADLEKNGLVQWPMIMGGDVPVVNIPGVAPGQMKLTGPVLADIYLGKITKWNDPAIAKLNPDVKLPDTAIAVVHRSDGSGTTFLFVNYLSQVSPEWQSKVGVGTSVDWPVGVGGKGNEGVANFSGQTPGAIGYVEYAYALQNKLAYVLLQNRDGAFVKPDASAFAAAAANADWASAPGFHLVLTNQPGKASWPITGASFILLHKSQDKPAQAAEVLKFFDWAYHNGGKSAEELDYVPIPSNVVSLVETTWSKDLKSADGKALWPVK